MKLLIIQLLLMTPGFCTTLLIGPTPFGAPVGQTVFLDIWASLDGNPGPGNSVHSVGAYDLLLQYDPQLFGYQQVTFAGNLGSAGTEAITGSSLTTVDSSHQSLQVYAVSLLDDAQLDALQSGGNPHLFTVSFNILSPAFGTITMSGNVADTTGNALTVQFGSATNVPEPGSISLFAFGVAVIGQRLARRRRVKRVPR